MHSSGFVPSSTPVLSRNLGGGAAGGRKGDATFSPCSDGCLYPGPSLLRIPACFQTLFSQSSFSKLQVDGRTRRRPAPQCPSHRTGYQLKYQQHGACCLRFKPHRKTSVPRGRTESKEPHCWACTWQQGQQQSAAWHEAAGKILPLRCHVLGGPHSASWGTRLMPMLNLWLQALSQQRALGLHRPSSRRPRSPLLPGPATGSLQQRLAATSHPQAAILLSQPTKLA